ncbi:UspA1: universal stress protein [Desulfosarcina variabilis str. Montpellier]|uniref:universal stress protein n=1 Tax=Desulfosarcina variabilis TaxID=2300 RepID=UPI003AFAE85E
MVFPIQAILCAVDFSPFCSLVCNYGVALARRAGVPLYLFHAVHHPQDRIHPTLVFERGGDLTHHMAAARQQMQRLMKDTPVDWEPVVRFGDPVEQITAVVDTLPPCLVVSASHGVSGFRRFFIGTVVERLSRTLDCPMLVVKPTTGNGHEQATDFKTVVVSCDASGHWHQLAQLIYLFEPDPTSSIYLVHAVEGPMEMPLDEPRLSYAQAQQAYQARVADHLDQAARNLFGDEKQVSTMVAPGEPEEMVLGVAQAQAADLIAVGVRPSGRVGRLIAGSTTEALLRHAPCCVLTVPEPKKQAASKGGGK